MEEGVIAKHPITKQIIEQGISYSAYRHLLDKLVAEGKTTGPKQSEELTNYTRLNVQRMNRLDKTLRIETPLLEALEKIHTKQYWVVLTEGWCGDAAQNLPLIAQLAASNAHISLHLLLRDEFPEVMDQYLTNGTRSIPKLIILNEALKELAVWGPRPKPASDMVAELKDSGRPHDEWVEKVHAWYAHDKTQSLQHELTELLIHSYEK